MKKIYTKAAAFCAAAVLASSLSACGQDTDDNETANRTSRTTTTTTAAEETSAETTTTAAENTAADSEETDAGTTVITSVLNDVTTAVSAETTASADTKTVEEENLDNTDNKADEEELVVNITMPEDLDISKPYVPDNNDIGSGEIRYPYPRNSVAFILYEAPSEDSEMVTVLPVGTEVICYTKISIVRDPRYAESWTYVSCGDSCGWCIEPARWEKANIALLDEIEFPLHYLFYDNYEEGMYRVLADSLDVKTSPSADAQTIETITQGQTVRAYGYSDDPDWLFVEVIGHSVPVVDNEPEIIGWIYTADSYDEKNVYPEDEYYQHYSEKYPDAELPAVTAKSQHNEPTTDKPVIYLYPEEKTDVDITLELVGRDVYTTYPKYNDGWHVTAYPDGRIVNKADNTNHQYLLWDAKDTPYEYDMSKGFCVKGEDTEKFLKEKLTLLGLNEAEMNEFIVYWLPNLEHNPYNLIAFQYDCYTENNKLFISPEPDSLLRVFMAYKPLDHKINIEPQQLKGFERKGFTVVEWGGERV